MRPQAKPRVNFFAQVSIDTDERRRRLQERTGHSVPRLIDEALRELETNLEAAEEKPTEIEPPFNDQIPSFNEKLVPGNKHPPLLGSISKKPRRSRTASRGP